LGSSEGAVGVRPLWCSTVVKSNDRKGDLANSESAAAANTLEVLTPVLPLHIATQLMSCCLIGESLRISEAAV
jgi:hypothetical protein